MQARAFSAIAVLNFLNSSSIGWPIRVIAVIVPVFSNAPSKRYTPSNDRNANPNPGISLIDFYIQGIEVIGNNPDYLRIKESLSEAASLKIRAKAASETQGFYEKERELDALDRAIEKDSTGLVGSLLGRSGATTSGTTQNSAPSLEKKSLSTEDLKFKLFNLKDMMNSGLISKEEYEQKKKVRYLKK